MNCEKDNYSVLQQQQQFQSSSSALAFSRLISRTTVKEDFILHHLNSNLDSLLRIKLDYCKFLKQLIMAIVRLNRWPLVLESFSEICKSCACCMPASSSPSLVGDCINNSNSNNDNNNFEMMEGVENCCHGEDGSADLGGCDASSGTVFSPLILQENQYMSDPWLKPFLLHLPNVTIFLWANWLNMPINFITYQHEVFLVPLERLQSSLNQVLIEERGDDASPIGKNEDSLIRWNRNCISQLWQETAIMMMKHEYERTMTHFANK